MANTPTLILGAEQWSLTPQVNSSLVILNTGNTPGFGQGTFALRPAAGNTGTIYYATDTFTQYRDNGTTWDLMEPALTGDVTAAAGSNALTLATVNSNVGTFGAVGVHPVFTVNGKGLITAASTALTGQQDTIYCGIASSPYRTNATTTFVAVTNFIWPGSTVKPTITSIRVNGFISTATRTINVNITDLTTAAVVATGTSAGTANNNIFGLTITPANVSTTSTVWQVSFAVSATTSTASIASVSIFY